MARVRCADGGLLDVVPVPVLDRTGAPYEVTLRLLRGGVPYGEVGERVGGALRVLADRLREQAVPTGTAERGVRGVAGDEAWTSLRAVLPRDAELFCWRARDPDDVDSSGELRATVQHVRRWEGHRWSTTVEVVLQAWGDDGTGHRAVLDVAGLRSLVDDLLAEAERVQAAPADGSAVRAG